jgi:C-terminal processing protease CtpA/Prc
MEAMHVSTNMVEKENPSKSKGSKKKRKSLGKKMKKIASKARQSLKGPPTAPNVKQPESDSNSNATPVSEVTIIDQKVNDTGGAPVDHQPEEQQEQVQQQQQQAQQQQETQQQTQQQHQQHQQAEPDQGKTSKRSMRLFSWKKRAPHKCTAAGSNSGTATNNQSNATKESVDIVDQGVAELSYTQEPSESEVEALLQRALEKAAMADSELITFQKQKSPANDVESAGLGGSGEDIDVSAEDQMMKEVKEKIAEAEAELHLWEEQKAARSQEKQRTLMQVEENAIVAQEEIRRWQTEKAKLREMEFRSQQRRVFELIGIERHRAALWLGMPCLTQELKVTFWKGKLGLKIAPGHQGRQVVSALPDLSGQAARKGMRLGDVIIGINNNMLPFTVTQTDFGKLVRGTKRPFLLNILRQPVTDADSSDGAVVSVSVSGSKVQSTDVEECAPAGDVASDTWYTIPCPGNGDMGVRLGNYVSYVVDDVIGGSVAENNGVRAGDVVVGLNGTPLSERIEPKLVAKMLCMIQRPYTLNLLREASRAPPKPVVTAKAAPEKGLFQTTKCEDKKRRKKRQGSPGSDSSSDNGSDNGSPGEEKASDSGRRGGSGKKARRVVIRFASETKMPSPSPRKTVFQRMANSQGRGAERSLAYPSNTSFLAQHPNDFKDATTGARTPPVDSKSLKNYRRSQRKSS